MANMDFDMDDIVKLRASKRKRGLLTPKKTKKGRTFKKVAPATPRRIAYRKVKKGMIMRKGYIRKRKFKKLGKTVGMKAKCQKLGFVMNKEMVGAVEDPDCVYVGHSTYDHADLTTTICIAILRKLLQLAKCNVTNIYDPLDWQSSGNADPLGFGSAGYRFVITISKFDGTQADGVYVMIPDETLSNLAVASTLEQTIRDMWRAGATPHASIDKLQIQRRDWSNATEASDTWFNVAQINMKDVKLHLYATSQMTMQNRTKGASQTDTDAVTIDNNPIEGFYYEFNGVPLTKINKTRKNTVPTGEANALARIRSNGMICRGAADMAGAGNLRIHWREPPVPSTFANCKKSRKLIINPGEINRTHLYSNWTGDLNKLLTKTLVFKSDGVAGPYSSNPGKCALFALEEVLNSGDQNKIKLQFEAQKTYGAYITIKKSPILVLEHTSDVTIVQN